jgi:hypothetical protein
MALPISLVTSPAAAEIVYDSITGLNYNGGVGCCLKTGQTVSLADVQRRVTEFEVWLGSDVGSTFNVEFYQLDGPNGVPGTLIWQSDVQSYPFTGSEYNRKVLKIDVPKVSVPDKFAWTLTTIARANNILISTGQPTIGSSAESWSYDFGNWSPSNSKFAARIHAIPEPVNALLAAVGFTILCLGFIRRRFDRC